LKKYNVIYADPPWKFGSQKTGGNMNSGAAQKYPVMKTTDIAMMPVEQLCADDCLLVMWYVGAMPEDALAVCKAWGFRLMNMNGFVWNKLTKTGKPFFGMGYATRAGSESALIGVKGKLGNLIKDRGVRAVISAPVGRHSEKPDDFRRAIVRMCGNAPRLEMFARIQYDGWDVFGNQVDNSIEIETRSDK
jgi:N6-adenosine-specific RNA methylase IME4